MLVKPQSRMCAIHIPARETKKDPQVSLGKQFAAPIKKKLPRAKRGKARENVKSLSALIPAGIAVKPIVKQSVNINEESDSKEPKIIKHMNYQVIVVNVCQRAFQHQHLH